MAEVASAYVSLLPSAKGFGKNLTSEVGGEVDSAGRKLGSGFGKMFAVAAGALAAAGVGSFLKDAVTGAGELEQSVGAIDTIFGKSAGKMHDWAKGAAQDVGLTRNEFNELGTLIGSQLKNGGTAMDQLGPKTKSLITAGADLSAMFGGSTKEAVEALSSALKGERDPIERYGVSLNQAKIDAEAAALGFEKVGGALSQEAQQAATLSLISKQTADAHGTFAKESSTLAGQQQRLSASWGNMKTQLGTALLPAITSIVTALNSGLGPAVNGIKAGFGSLTSFLAPFVAQIKGVFAGGSGGGVMASLQSFGDTIRANLLPVLQTMAATFRNVILPAVTSFASYVGAALLPVFRQVWSVLSTQVVPIVARVATFLYGTLVPAVARVATTVGKNLRPVFDALVGTLRGQVLPSVSKVLAKFQDWMPTIQRVITHIVKVTGFVLGLASAILGKVLPPLIRFAGFLAGAIVSATVTAIGVVVKIIGAVTSFGEALLAGATKATQFATTVGRKVAEVLNFFVTLPGKIKSNLGSVGTLLVQAGKDLLNGMMDGIKSMAGNLANAAKDAVKGAVDGAKNFLRIGSPSKLARDEVGQWIPLGMADGVTAKAKALKESVVSALKGAIDGVSPLLKKAESWGEKLGDALGVKGLGKGLKSAGAALKKQVGTLGRDLSKALAKAVDLRDQYDAIKSGVADAFKGDWFSAVGQEAELDADGNIIKPATTALQEFFSSITGNNSMLQGVLGAFQQLKAIPGISKDFLLDLLNSGNSELVLGFAGDPALAAEASSLFTATTDLANQLGSSVADDRLGEGIYAVRDEIAGLRADLTGLDKSIGQVINGAAAQAHRNKKAKSKKGKK